MDLFSLHCPTCQVRIRVRHPSAIGRVLHCPKCRSFVEITAPPGWQPPAETLPDTSTGDSDELRYSDTPSPLATAELTPQAEPPNEPAIGDHQPNSWRARWIAAAAAVTLAVMAGGWWLTFRPRVTTPLAGGAAHAAHDLDEHANAAAEPAAQGPQRAASARAEPAIAAPDRPAAPDTGGATAAGSLDPTADVSPSSAAAESANSLSDDGAPAAAATDAPKNEPETPEPGAPGFAETTPEDTAPPDEPLEEPSVVQPPPLELRPVDAAAGLARPLLGFHTRGTPLYRWLAVVEQLSGCPVTLDLPALAARQVPADQPITAETTAGTTQDLLDATLGKLGLGAVATDAGIWITARHADDSADEPFTARYDLSELVDPPLAGEVEALADALRHLFGGGASDGMRITLDGHTLLVTARAVAQAPVEAVLAHWRAVRNDAAASSTERPAPSAWALHAEVLHRPVTVNFSDETPLTQVVWHLSEVTKSALVINARELRRAGLPHDLPVILSADGEPLARVLAQGLETWRLALLPSPARALEITTEADAQLRREVEFFDVRDLAARTHGASLVELVQQFAAAETGRGLAIHLDPLSGYLLARGPVETLLQLESQLAAWRAEGRETSSR